MSSDRRSAGFVAILGAPNTGKSTLLNALVGAKVSIVSPKVQTTRRRIVGITTVGTVQVIFVDTPGIFEPRRRLEKAMVDAAWSGEAEADLVCLVVDAERGIRRDDRRVIDALAKDRRPVIVAINKIDKIKPERLLPLTGEIDAALKPLSVFMVSALTGDGCDALLGAVAAALPEGPWLYPEDQLSDLSSRALAAEITREKVFLQLHQELPYAITVETEAYTESADGREIRIDQTIYVQRPSQKGIVLGKRGQQIRAIGEAARIELEELLQARVHLFLFVKVREDWQDNPERFAEMGLPFPKG